MTCIYTNVCLPPLKRLLSSWSLQGLVTLLNDSFKQVFCNLYLRRASSGLRLTLRATWLITQTVHGIPLKKIV